MKYTVQVFNDSRAFCRASSKADAQRAFDKFCREYPDDRIVFSSRKGIIAEQLPGGKSKEETK